jgi:hypothetical protein
MVITREQLRAMRGERVEPTPVDKEMPEPAPSVGAASPYVDGEKLDTLGTFVKMAYQVAAGDAQIEQAYRNTMGSLSSRDKEVFDLRIKERDEKKLSADELNETFPSAAVLGEPFTEPMGIRSAQFIVDDLHKDKDVAERVARTDLDPGFLSPGEFMNMVAGTFKDPATGALALAGAGLSMAIVPAMTVGGGLAAGTGIAVGEGVIDATVRGAASQQLNKKFDWKTEMAWAAGLAAGFNLIGGGAHYVMSKGNAKLIKSQLPPQVDTLSRVDKELPLRMQKEAQEQILQGKKPVLDKYPETLATEMESPPPKGFPERSFRELELNALESTDFFLVGQGRSSAVNDLPTFGDDVLDVTDDPARANAVASSNVVDGPEKPITVVRIKNAKDLNLLRLDDPAPESVMQKLKEIAGPVELVDPGATTHEVIEALRFAGDNGSMNQLLDVIKKEYDGIHSNGKTYLGKEVKPHNGLVLFNKDKLQVEEVSRFMGDRSILKTLSPEKQAEIRARYEAPENQAGYDPELDKQISEIEVSPETVAELDNQALSMADGDEVLLKQLSDDMEFDKNLDEVFDFISNCLRG